MAMTETEAEQADVPPEPDVCMTRRLPGPRPEGRDRYTISEVASICGLSAHTLRWYERIGLMPHVDRSHTGQRRFTNADLDWLDLVAKLRLTGMPVAAMVRYAELVRAGEHTCPERHELLVATREDALRRVAELQETLAVLNYKIDIYAAYKGPGTGGSGTGAGHPEQSTGTGTPVT